MCLHIELLDLDASFGYGVVNVVMALRGFGNGTSLIPLLLFITYGWIDCAHCWLSLLHSVFYFTSIFIDPT